MSLKYFFSRQSLNYAIDQIAKKQKGKLKGGAISPAIDISVHVSGAKRFLEYYKKLYLSVENIVKEYVSLLIDAEKKYDTGDYNGTISDILLAKKKYSKIKKELDTLEIYLRDKLK